MDESSDELADAVSTIVISLTETTSPRRGGRVPEASPRRVCVIDEGPIEAAKAFVRAHYDLPFKIFPVHGVLPHYRGKPLKRQDWLSRGSRKLARTITGRTWNWEITGALEAFFRREAPDAVLAEWGPTAVRAREACVRCGIPLIAHFHGYDASMTSVLERMREDYQLLFRDAAALVVVSRAMGSKLLGLGAPEEKVLLNPYGVDCDLFSGATPGEAPPHFVAVGRFVEKKAPQLTLLAFASVVRQIPDARLVFVGDGPLRPCCEDLAKGLGIQRHVEFLGWMDAEGIRRALCRARCFVQHSLTAPDGDSEGLPNTVLEAGASGLPVVSTHHAGIPDAVIDGETGFLVDEHDAPGMAESMASLARDAELAGRMGLAAQSHIRENYSIEKSLAGLAAIIRDAIARRRG